MYIKNNIFIPKIINVGYQKRNDTYTKMLAYVIYYDEKGVLRKETSWNNWRDKKIEPQEFNNEPTSGFVLNKKVGGSSSGWNYRQSYVRIYDPRNFEFEITIENLLYILENTSSIKGKGLEGEFVYGWDGKDLILIPTSSPDYIEINKWNDILFKKETIKANDLIIGARYLTKQNEQYIYMGRFDYWDYEYLGSKFKNERKYTNKGKKFFFYDNGSFETIKSINGKIIDVLDSNCCENYSDLFEELEGMHFYSPEDYTKNIITHYTLEEFLNKEKELKRYHWENEFYDEYFNKYIITYQNNENSFFQVFENEYENNGSYYFGYNRTRRKKQCTLEEFFNNVKPVHLDVYLQNGKFHERKY